MSKWKETTITVNQNYTDGADIRTWLLTVIPTSSIVIVVNDIDYSQTPIINNLFGNAVIIDRGSGTRDVTASRWRNNSWNSASLTIGYDFVLNSGDVLDILYQ